MNLYGGCSEASSSGEQKSSLSPPSEGKVASSFPPATSSTLQDTFSAYLKSRDGEHLRHHKSRSRSHSRSSSSLSNLLLVATERLGQETNRANASDQRCVEVLSHLRTMVQDRDQLRRTLTKVQEELSLYKLQLDVAQNEIFRAQKIVDGVDKARVEAEEQAAKDRTIARQLVSERAVWIAREEGRNEGYEEGLREGRRWASEAARMHADDYLQDRYEEAEADEDPEGHEPSPHNSSPSSRRGFSSPSRSVRSTLPDAASYASTLPIHAMNPSAPSNTLPSAPIHSVTPRPPSAHPERSPSARSSRPLPRAPARSPEPIDIHTDRSNTNRAPSTRRAASPSMSYRSVALPPDGFIPTVGADSVISLPPPHELSRPVSVAGDETVRTPGGANRRRTMSNVSRGSTRISQYDILSPPKPLETPVTRSTQVVQDWRAANEEPSERRQRQPLSTSEDVNNNENASRRNGPRRPREIVMPMPLSTSMHTAYAPQPSTSTGAPSQPLPQPTHTAPLYAAPATMSYTGVATTSHAPPPPPPPPQAQGYFDDNAPTRPRSAIAWIKTRFNRSFSASTIPHIEIEPPSNPASNPSTDNTLNAVLLTPDDAGYNTLPQHFVPELADAVASVHSVPASTQTEFGTSSNAGGSGSVIVLPDNHLPPGFVPLSPILPSLHNIAPVMPFPSAPAPAPAPAHGSVPPPAPSPQPPAYTPRDIYAPLRPATAASMRVRNPDSDIGVGSPARARGASIGSAMLQTSPAPLNRPLSIFSSES
ncbi:hypothetical protein B0H11DRAFT_2378327 [Mycena galericulata]|nr:hypothetical protein B0H11DRAFT_2378327 [Mycena galericulata]